MALYLHSLSLHFSCCCSCSSSVEGALYLAQPEAHCAALSLDWVWLRQPTILSLSMEDKLHSTMRKARMEILTMQRGETKNTKYFTVFRSAQKTVLTFAQL